MHHAAYNGHLEATEYLIQIGSVVNASNKQDRRPLHFAAYMGHDGILKTLIARGADVDVGVIQLFLEFILIFFALQ